MTQDTTRARTPRQEEIKTARRRRDETTIDRNKGMVLERFSRDDLDFDNYDYHWANDAPGSSRVTDMYKNDWDKVQTSEIRGESYHKVAENTDSSEHIRDVVSVDAAGRPVYSYLMKKRKDFFNEDLNALLGKKNAELRDEVTGPKSGSLYTAPTATIGRRGTVTN